MTLIDINISESAVIDKVNTEKDMRDRLLDMGFVNGERVSLVFKSPLGDPLAYLVRGAVFALREEDARHISILCGR